jgi:hypothetical protein
VNASPFWPRQKPNSISQVYKLGRGIILDIFGFVDSGQAVLFCGFAGDIEASDRNLIPQIVKGCVKQPLARTTRVNLKQCANSIYKAL